MASWVRPLCWCSLFGEHFRDNAHDVYAGREGGIGHQAHQAFTAAAIDQFAVLATPMYFASIGGVLGEERVIAIFGAAKDGDGPDLHH